MSEFIIYHNPRCSKSRQALALLKDNNIEPTVVEYLKTPLETSALQDILAKLKCNVKDITRTKEAIYKELALKGKSDDELLQAITDNPKLLERPIVIRKNKAIIGRPLENVLELINA